MNSQAINEDRPSANLNREKLNLLIGVTGSVAAIKLPLVIEKLQKLPFNIRIVGTTNSFNFFETSSIQDINANVKIYSDLDEWSSWKSISDPVLHIELRKWADIFLIAPLDANTLAKLSHGICDNLLTCIARAWDLNKPLLFCPAMNTFMWTHPSTDKAIKKLTSWKYQMIPVATKMLACGDFGQGAMAEVDTIVNTLLECSQKIVPPNKH